MKTLTSIYSNENFEFIKNFTTTAIKFVVMAYAFKIFWNNSIMSILYQEITEMQSMSFLLMVSIIVMHIIPDNINVNLNKNE